MAHRGKQSMRKFKKLLKGGSRAKMSAADWREVRDTLGTGAGPGVRKKANMAKKKKKKSATKRIGAALTRWLKRQNPAFKKAKGVRVQRLKGGVIKFIPQE